MTTRGWMIGGAVLAAAGILAILLARGTDRAAATMPHEAAVGAGPRVASGHSAPVPAARPAEHPRGTLDAPARQRMLAQLEAARARRQPTSSPTQSASGGGEAPGLPTPDPLDKEYVRAQVRELVPMIQECYESALADEATLAGTLTVEFTIGGEPDVGGLVETSNVVGEDSTITNAQMVECVRETMYGAQFVAPTDGGQVVVRYPFKFSSQ